VFVHRLVSFINGDKQCVGFIPDIYKLLDKYQLVGYTLTFLKDALFPSKSVWRAILRQHVLQSNTQTMKQELMHNGNEWLSPNVVDTNRVELGCPSIVLLSKNQLYGKWIHKSPSDQCNVILGLAVSKMVVL